MTTLMHVSDARAGVDAARRPLNLFSGMERMVRRRAVYRELMSLDDRLLADIGLTRGDVAAVAHRAAEEGPDPSSQGEVQVSGREMRRMPRPSVSELPIVTNWNSSRTPVASPRS